MKFSGKQTTLKQEVSLSGLGVFTGENVSLTLCPALENTGVVFQRVDLPSRPLIPATLDQVVEMPRCTRLRQGEVELFTVEHLLSAIKAYEIDNILIRVHGSEIPMGDGSAALFVDAIEKAGVVEQSKPKQRYTLKKPVYWSSGEVHLVALPSSTYCISYTLHYPHSSFLRSQYYSFIVESGTYKEEIAPCRTFSLYEEIEALLAKKLLKGGGIENGVVIRGDQVMNPEGTRFSDEMVRHKVLDLMGDLSLVGVFFTAHIIAIRSGHSSNLCLARLLSQNLVPENS